MPDLILKSTGELKYVPEHKVAAALEGGLYAAPDGDTAVTVRDERSGTAAEVAAKDFETFSEFGDSAETGDQFRAREDAARKEREHGGALSTVGTGLESAADTATFGGYGLLSDAVLGDDYTTARRERQEVNPYADLAGTAVGVLAPGGLAKLPGVAGKVAKSTPMAMAERLGTKISRSGAEKGLAGQLSRTAAGFGVEGGLVGVGETVQELAISEDPVTLERAASSLGSNLLYGGAIGGGVGLAGKSLSKALEKGQKMLKEGAERGAKIGDDLADLDKAGLRELQREAKFKLGEEVAAETRAINETSEAFRLVSGADRKVLTDGRKWLRRHLDDPKGLAEKPDSVAKSLRKEEEILRKTIADQDATLARLAKRDDELINRLTSNIEDFSDDLKLKGEEAALYGDLFGRKTTRKGVSLDKAQIEEFRAVLQSGAAKKMQREAIEKLPAQLEQNLQLQRRIDSIKHGTAPRLAEIQGALDNVGKVRPASALEQVAQGSVFGAVTSLASPLGVAAPIIGAKISQKVTDLLFGRIAKVSSDASMRSAKALEAFMDTSKKAARSAPPLASKTLTSVAFGSSPSTISNQLAKKPRQGLAGAYKERERELRELTRRDETGEYRMQRSAREQMAERLKPVRAVDPVLADRIETIAARRVEFLASKLPKRPDIPVMQVGPDNWRPSDMAMRQFARFVAAVEDPGSVEERLADGSVTPEDAEAIRTVYPEMFADIKARIIASLPDLRESLPYHRRLALSIFSGVPVDPAMDPKILAVLQGNFAEEVGSEGGTVAPRAQAQFGSITKPNPTAAQERAG